MKVKTTILEMNQKEKSTSKKDLPFNVIAVTFMTSAAVNVA